MYRQRLTIIVVCMLFIAAAAGAQKAGPEIPDTPSGKLLGHFIEALNSGEESSWKAFIDNRWMPSDKEGAFDRRMDLFTRLFCDLGGCDLHKILVSSELDVLALVKARKSSGPFEWVEFQVYSDTVSNDKMMMISVRPGDAPGFESPGERLSDDELIVFMDKFLEEQVAKERFSGTVLVAKDGIPFYKRVYGEACKRYNVPNKFDTKFNLGSMNKMFTGVAIMQLMEQGKLSLDDKVGKYLPDIPHKEIADNVTIDQLLSHRSGMQDYWDELDEVRLWEIRTVDDMGTLVFDDSLLFEPGTDFHYSNSGPIVLGMIIEKITGQSYFDYVHENIYKPAGMINSDCYEMDREVPNLAIGYTKIDYNGEYQGDDDWRNNFFLHVIKGGPAGGGFSTVEDLLNFDIALRQNKLISKESFDLMTTAKTEMRPGSGYAYLFQDRTVNGHRLVGHGGGAPGINAMLDMYLDSGYTVAVMSNYDQGASLIARKLQELLTK